MLNGGCQLNGSSQFSICQNIYQRKVGGPEAVSLEDVSRFIFFFYYLLDLKAVLHFRVFLRNNYITKEYTTVSIGLTE
jgi:hypothetical protein